MPKLTKWIKDLTEKSYKTVKKEHTSVNLVSLDQQWLLEYDTKSTSNKRKTDKLDFINIKSFYVNGYYQESRKTTHRMRKYLYFHTRI